MSIIDPVKGVIVHLGKDLRFSRLHKGFPGLFCKLIFEKILKKRLDGFLVVGRFPEIVALSVN